MRIKGNIYNTNPKATVRYCVGDYLTEMNKAYTEKYRVEFEKLTAQREREKERWQNEIRRGWSDVRLQEADKQRHKDALESISKAMADLQARAKADFDEVLAEADERFERHARPTGDKVDLATVELLKSDVLTDNELWRLADDFSGNVSMSRIISKYADNKAEQAEMKKTDGRTWRTIAAKCRQSEFNYEPLKEYAALCEEALSDDDLKCKEEIHANSYHKVLTDGYAERFDSVKELYVTEEYTGEGQCK